MKFGWQPGNGVGAESILGNQLSNCWMYLQPDKKDRQHDLFVLAVMLSIDHFSVDDFSDLIADGIHRLYPSRLIGSL